MLTKEAVRRLVKVAARVFYRGMGTPHIKNVMDKGLPAGKFMTTDPDIALHYTGIGAQNVFTDWSSVTMPKVNVLKKLGLDIDMAYSRAPVQAKPEGSLLKITLPDNFPLRRGAISDLSEWTSPEQIPPKYIKVLKTDYPYRETSYSASSRLTPRQIRLLEKIEKDPIALPKALNLLEKSDKHMLGTREVSVKDQINFARAQRHLLTKSLQSLLTKKEV